MWVREVLGYQNFRCIKELKMGHKKVARETVEM